MRVSEQILYALVRSFYRSPVSHNPEMRQALSDREHFVQYRSNRLDTILTAAREYGVEITNRVVLDLGCGEGAITSGYVAAGAKQAIGVDVDEEAVHRARQQQHAPNLSFCVGGSESVPLPGNIVDTIISYDVFEHLTCPHEIISECYRVLRPGGTVLISTNGWGHPFAPHLWATMPVPWAHVIFSERTVMRTCRKVYTSAWYVPNMFDVSENGQRLEKYLGDEIPTTYVNKLWIRDFEGLFESCGFIVRFHPLPFNSKYARWTQVFLGVPWIREFITSSLWIVLRKLPETAASSWIPDVQLAEVKG